MVHVMSLLFLPKWIGSMSHVDLKKGPCHPVEFKVGDPIRVWVGWGGGVLEEAEYGSRLMVFNEIDAGSLLSIR